MDEYMDRYHRFLEGEDDQLEVLVENIDTACLCL